jgi:hypothetical protein
MTRALTLVTAVLAVGIAAPAYAATATMIHRTSVSHIELIAGYGPASISFSDGSLAAQGLQAPAQIVLSSGDSGAAKFAAYEVTFNALWDQRQDYSFQTLGSDAVLHASGTLAVSMGSTWYNNVGGLGGSPATQYYTSTHWQAFEFVLDEATAFTFTGSTADQRLEMFRWSGTDWVTAAYVISPGSGESLSNSGQIDAGHYLLRNAPAPVFRAQTAVTGNGWDYTLTLHDTVAAVPEPATVVSMLAGLGLMSWRMRRRSPQ